MATPLSVWIAGRGAGRSQIMGGPVLLSASATEAIHASANSASGQLVGGGGGGSGNLFNSSWETALGCGLTPLKDGVWDDYGGASICTDGPSGGPAAEVTADEAADGSRSLRVWQMPGNQNGTDFRLEKALASQSGTVYFRWYQKWEAAWHWGSSDHKMCITGGAAVQEIYMNVRADFSSGYNPLRGRMCVHNNPYEIAWTDNRVGRLMQPGQWYRIEYRLVLGTHGSIAARLDGIDCVFTIDAGSGLDINDMPVCLSGIDFFKMDSTYNDGASITAPMAQYWDHVSVDNTGWIGA